jgi:hypothetical protein
VGDPCGVDGRRDARGNRSTDSGSSASAGRAQTRRQRHLVELGASITLVGPDGFNYTHGQIVFHAMLSQAVDRDSNGVGLLALVATPSFDDEHYPAWVAPIAGFAFNGIVVGVGGGGLIPGRGDPIGTFAFGFGGTMLLGPVGVAVQFLGLIHSDPIVFDMLLGIGIGFGRDSQL